MRFAQRQIEAELPQCAQIGVEKKTGCAADGRSDHARTSVRPQAGWQFTTGGKNPSSAPTSTYRRTLARQHFGKVVTKIEATTMEHP